MDAVHEDAAALDARRRWCRTRSARWRCSCRAAGARRRSRAGTAIVAALAFVYSMFAIGGAGAETVLSRLPADSVRPAGVRLGAGKSGQSQRSEGQKYDDSAKVDDSRRRVRPLTRVVVKHAARGVRQRRGDRRASGGISTSPRRRISDRRCDEYDALPRAARVHRRRGAVACRRRPAPASIRSTRAMRPSSRRAASCCATWASRSARAEPAAQRRAFESWGMPIAGAIQPPGQARGRRRRVARRAHGRRRAAAIARTTKASGSTARFSATTIDEFIVVPLPHWRGPGDVFHLMSIISPVDRDLAVVYSPLMPVPFREALAGARHVVRRSAGRGVRLDGRERAGHRRRASA